MSNKFYIYFNDYIIDSIKYIIMEENHNIEINNNTHKNYIYIKKNGYITYTFNGFFKEDFFVITIDSYHELLQTNIEHKDVILLDLKWYLKQDYFYLDIQNEIVKKDDCYILNIRKDLFENYNSYYLQNYLKTNKINKHTCYLYKNNILLHNIVKLNIHNLYNTMSSNMSNKI